MAVVQISKIQLRRGRKNTTGIPQLASGEMAWAIDTQELYVGNGAVSEGAPAVGNTKILTEHDNILDLLGQYNYRTGNITTGLNGGLTTRTLQQRLDEGKVNAASFGINSSLTVDNTALIQNAINNLYKASTSITDHVTLEFDPGVYKITGTIYVPSFVRIAGAGKASYSINPSYPNTKIWENGTVFNFVKGGINLGTNLTLSGTARDAIAIYTAPSGLATTTVTGSGTGATVNVRKYRAGTSYINTGVSPNTEITIISSGKGYVSGDQIKVAGSLLGGADGTNDLTIPLVAATTMPTFGTSTAFEFINSDTLHPREISFTTTTNQAKRVLMQDFTINIEYPVLDAYAMSLNFVKNSEFRNISAYGNWTNLTASNINSIAFKLTGGAAENLSTRDNVFSGLHLEGFSYCAYSVTTVINNEFIDCTFKKAYEGVRLGDALIDAVSGPRKNIVTNSIFENIDRHGLIVGVGYGNQSRGNKYINVGNDNGSSPVCGQIKFTQAGNSSVQDYFDRTELTHTHFDVTYYPEIDGHGSYIENAPTTITLPYTIIPLAAFRIPLHDTTGVEVSYVFQSNTFAQMRKGTISIAIDKANLDYQLVDDYNYVGTGGQDSRVIFTADIQNNALVVFYTNLNTADSNSFTYTYTITS